MSMMDSVTTRYSEPLSSNTTLLFFLSTENSTTTDLSKQWIILEKLYFWVFGVSLCLLSVIGVVTNTVNIYALTLTVRVNKRPMYHCLICMAAVDMLLMWLLLVMSTRFYLQDLGNPNKVREMYHTDTIDYASYFIYSIWFIVANIFMTISNWSVVTMGIFRLIAVFAPLKASTLCTVRRVQLTLISICVLSVLINLPTVLSKKLMNGEFMNNEAMMEYNAISVIFAVPIPIISVLIINIILIARIRLYRAQMERLLEGQRNEDSTRLSGSQQNIRQGETTLIAVSLFTVFMSLPDVTYFVAEYTNKFMKMGMVERNVYYLTAAMCIYINYAGNFFFYVLLNKPFRNLLWKKVRGTESAAAPSSTHTTVRSMPPRSTAYESIRLTSVAVNGQADKNGHT